MKVVPEVLITIKRQIQAQQDKEITEQKSEIKEEHTRAEGSAKYAP